MFRRHLLISTICLTLSLISFAHAEILYVPKSLKNKKNPDLLVMLHGCKTTAVEFAMGTRMNELAERYGFVVWYPEQSPAANSDRCWNWFFNFNQARGYGEPAQIMTGVLKIKTKYRIGRVFVAGMSAGGAMASILASTYADQISGVAVHSGLSYLAAFSVEQANWAIVHGSVTPAPKSAAYAYENSLHPRKQVPMIAFQGDIDTRVYPKNVEDVVQHFALFNDLIDDRTMNGSFSSKPTASHLYKPEDPNLHSYTVYEYENLMRKVIVHGMAHAWSGGNPSVPRNDQLGPDASTIIVKFLGIAQKKKTEK